MTVLTVITNYCAYAVYFKRFGTYSGAANEYILPGYYYDPTYGDELFRSAIRFPLTDLPDGQTITQVRLRLNCLYAGGPNHILDIDGYDVYGQSDPALDTYEVMWKRCTSSHRYYSGIDLRTAGVKWITLGGLVCQDVQNAKSAVNRFSIGLLENGDNDMYAVVSGLESGGDPPQLEITYVIPTVGYGYSNGLVVVSTF